MYIYIYIHICILLHVCYTYYIYNLIAQPLLYSRSLITFIRQVILFIRPRSTDPYINCGPCSYVAHNARTPGCARVVTR